MLSPSRSAAISLLVAACGPASYPGGEPQRAEEAAPLAYAAASDAARVAGSLTVQRAGLVFGNGVTLYTRQLAPRSALDAVDVSGESFADVAGNYADAADLRRVIEQEGGRLCGAERPTYAALLDSGGHVSVILFTGEAPPQADAPIGEVCAALAYTRP